MRLGQKIKQMSLFRQLLFLSALMLLILLLSYLITNMFAKRIIEDKVTDTVNQIFFQVEEKMKSFDADIEGISSFIYYSPTIQEYLSTDDPITRVLANREVLAVFANAMLLKTNIRGVQLFDEEGTYLANLGIGSVEQLPVQTSSIQYSGLVDIDISDPRDSKRVFYTITIPIYKLDNNRIATRFVGMGRFFMDASNFTPILQSAKATESSQVLLLDPDNRLIAAEGNKPGWSLLWISGNGKATRTILSKR
ncbi:cache domain-containing protein [Paenibacillus sp. CAU 1782]